MAGKGSLTEILDSVFGEFGSKESSAKARAEFMARIIEKKSSLVMYDGKLYQVDAFEVEVKKKETV